MNEYYNLDTDDKICPKHGGGNVSSFMWKLEDLEIWQESQFIRNLQPTLLRDFQKNANSVDRTQDLQISWLKSTSVWRSPNWAKSASKPTAGVEPAIFWLEVKRVNHYATQAITWQFGVPYQYAMCSRHIAAQHSLMKRKFHHYFLVMTDHYFTISSILFNAQCRFWP